jgi:circadian clock protein KaiB
VDQLTKENEIMNKYVLKLYITGQTIRSERAIANLQRICHEELGDRYELVIIDVLERPQLAENERIVATPTLVKTLPPPSDVSSAIYPILIRFYWVLISRFRRSPTMKKEASNRGR